MKQKSQKKPSLASARLSLIASPSVALSALCQETVKASNCTSRARHLPSTSTVSRLSQMAILFCPVKGCNKSDFGVSTARQPHVNEHLKKDHGVVSLGPIKKLRKRQLEVWKARRDGIQDPLDGKLDNRKTQFMRFMSNPSKDVPNEELDCDYLHNEWAKLMDAHNDGNSDFEGESDGEEESEPEDERTASRVRLSRVKLEICRTSRKTSKENKEDEGSVEYDADDELGKG